MTRQDIIEHWRKGARDALELARLAHQAEKNELALFHCHLAVEKALKAAYMERHHEDHPYTHDLAHLAGLVGETFEMEDMTALQKLTDFVVDARYSDPFWAEKQATSKNAAHWIAVTEHLLSRIRHEV
jgi:HEPN domain-containing protein